MTNHPSTILSLNAGSSSIKFALYSIGKIPEELFCGELAGMGTKETTLSFTDKASIKRNSICLDTSDKIEATDFLVNWLGEQPGFKSIQAIGHRVVHGLEHTEPVKITSVLLDELKTISSYAPEHLPLEIKLVHLFQNRYPEMVQIACFDTSFHTDMPVIAKLLTIPRKLTSMGIRRYGFHGISFSYLVEELETLGGTEKSNGKTILAHLGNGSSLAAVLNGKSIDTSMGFTPAAGMIMSTRTGDIDPGLAAYLVKSQGFSAEEFSHLVNHESGLLGVSETSSDMRDLLKTKQHDARASEAVNLFCYQAKKWIGSFAAALNGLDTLVFSGGIGEHAPEIRSSICEGLQFLGIEIDVDKNCNNAPLISSDKSRVEVRVIETNEQLMIARSVCKMMNYPKNI